MKQLLPIFLIGAGLLSGCTKEEVAPAAPPKVAKQFVVAKPPTENVPAAPTPTDAPAPAPAPAATATPAPAAGNYTPGTSAFDDLTKHLNWFVISKKRFPKDVDELLTANRLPKPALPPGGRLVINQQSKTVEYQGPK